MDPAVSQSGFSRASRQTSARMFWRVAGRPGLPCMDLAAQRRRMMSRCQRRIVSGVTSSRSPWRRAFGITLSRVTSRARSAQFRLGRHVCRRCRTASWWRRIKISAVFQVSSRRDSRSQEAARVVRRKTNRRHITDDHHGRTSEKATLLIKQGRGRFSARTGLCRDAGVVEALLDARGVREENPSRPPGRRSEWGRYESAPVTEGAVFYNGAGGRAFAAMWDLRLVGCQAAGRASR